MVLTRTSSRGLVTGLGLTHGIEGPARLPHDRRSCPNRPGPFGGTRRVPPVGKGTGGGRTGSSLDRPHRTSGPLGVSAGVVLIGIGGSRWSVQARCLLNVPGCTSTSLMTEPVHSHATKAPSRRMRFRPMGFTPTRCHELLGPEALSGVRGIAPRAEHPLVMALNDLDQSCSPNFPTRWRWSG